MGHGECSEELCVRCERIKILEEHRSRTSKPATDTRGDTPGAASSAAGLDVRDPLDIPTTRCPRCNGLMPENFRAGVEAEDGTVEVFCMRCAVDEHPEVLGFDSRMLVGMIGMLGESLGQPMPAQTHELLHEAIWDAMDRAAKKKE